MSRARIIEPDRLLPEIIDPALLVLGKPYDSRSAAALLAYIAAHESDHLTATVQWGGGPARSLWQIEPKTYRDSMRLARKRDLGAVLRVALMYWSLEPEEGFDTDPPFEVLGKEAEQFHAAGAARLVLWEATSATLPPLSRLQTGSRGLQRGEFQKHAAAYWHKWWCRGCAGTPEKFIKAARWLDSNGGDPLTYQPIGGRW